MPVLVVGKTCKDDDDRNKEIQKIIVLISRTLAQHVRYKLGYICLSSSAKQLRTCNHHCYPACCPSVQCVHGVLAAGLSKFQKRADLKENLSSKRDTASIESEMRWKESYLPLL